MATIYEKGTNYYFLDTAAGEELASYLSDNGYNFSDFGGFVITPSDSVYYAGYYFDVTEINDDEYDILEMFSPEEGLAFRAIWDSVQAHYFGI